MKNILRIISIATYDMRNDKHFQFFRAFGRAVREFGASVLKIERQFAEWAARFEREDEALKKISKSAFTKRIQDADRARDKTFAGMVEITGAYLKHFNPMVAEAARRLKIVFDTYGNVAKKPLNEETSAVYNLLQELKGKYAADCVAVRIDEWVGRLEMENNAFDQLMTERFSETAARTAVVLKEARREVDESFREICDIINVYVLLEGEAGYADFINTLNAVIAKYAVHAKPRGGGVGEDEGEEELEDGEDAETGDGGE